MSEFWVALVILLIGGISGSYIRSQFDNRDMRRKILDEHWNKYLETVTLVKKEYKRMHMEFASLINPPNSIAYETIAEKILNAEGKLVDSAKRIQDDKLVKMIDRATDLLYGGYVGYTLFIMRYNELTESQRNTMDSDARSKMEKEFPDAMDLIYKRYWQLVTKIWFL